MRLPSKKSCLIALAVLMPWLLTLGLHIGVAVSVLCTTTQRELDWEPFIEGRTSSHLTVFGNYHSGNFGIPFLLTVQSEPFSGALDFALTVDQTVAESGITIDSVELLKPDGSKFPIVFPQFPRAGIFTAFNAVGSDKRPGRILRRATIAIPVQMPLPEESRLIVHGRFHGTGREFATAAYTLSVIRRRSVYPYWLLVLYSFYASV